MRKAWLVCLIIIVMMGNLHLISHPIHVRAQAEQAAWTILFYSTADTSNIEQGMMLDVNEAEYVGSSPAVNLVAQVDRTDSDPSWTDTRRFLLSQDGDWQVVNSPILESLGEVNQGDPASLVDFALWGITNYPADHYAIILSDHGGAWTGFGWDATNNDDSLSMMELNDAFGQITRVLGRPFDLIGFDACLMSQLEVITMLAPYAQYAILAEETEPAFGWAYDYTLQRLAENPTMGAADLGRAIVQDYVYSYRDGDWKDAGYPRYDLNLIDLAAVPAANVALSSFVHAVQANSLDVVTPIGDARNNAIYFGGETPDEADYYSSIDLIHFLTVLTQLSANVEVNTAAEGLISATKNLIVYHEASQTMANASGISIYFPRNPRVFESYGGAYAQEVYYFSAWQSFLATYYAEATAANPGDLSGVVEILDVYPGDEVSIHQPAVVDFVTNGQNIAAVIFTATLMLEDGIQIMLDQSELVSAVELESGEQVVDFPDGYQDNEFSWNAEMPVITDGTVNIPVLLIESSDDNSLYYISGDYIYQSGESVTAYLTVDIETEQVINVWGISDIEGSTAPFNIRPQPGDQFFPTWRFLDESGEVVLIPASSNPLTFGSDPFSYHYEPSITGDYTLSILVEDMAGNIYVDSTIVTVNNDDLDINYRGYTEVGLGLNFLYPWDWPPPTFIEASDGSQQTQISDPGGFITIYMDAFAAGSDQDMIDTAVATLDEFGVEYDLAESEEVTVWGYTGTIIPYTFTLEDGDHIGQMLAIYVPDLETGFLIDLDAPAEMEEDAVAVFDVVIGSLNFFMPPQ